MEKAATIDDYISTFSPEIQKILTEIRGIIREAAPEATEKISWQMPTFYLNGNLVHFAGHKGHVGFYPGAEGISHFLEKLGQYKTSKGAVQFPYAEPLPRELIIEITRFRVSQQKARG